MNYIWVCRWEEFQHYRPERDRPPAWIKDYTKQLDDDDYRGLTLYQRGILHGLRAAFSRSRGRLAAEPSQLTRRLNGRVTTAHLKALSDAGFIQVCSRETLDRNLELFYSPPRARVEVEEEVRSKIPPTPTGKSRTPVGLGDKETPAGGDYHRAANMTRNGGHQYELDVYREELDRYTDLTPEDKVRLEELRAALNGTPVEVDW